MLQSNLTVILAPGALVTLAHGLKDTDDRPLAPKQVMPSKATPIAVVGTPTTTQVTFQNQGPVADTATFECICPHSVQQALSDPATCYWRGASSGGIASNLSFLGGPLIDTEVVIYARPTGSDLTGDGSLAHPYATYVRARRDIPMYVLPHTFYTIDITGISETLPDHYIDPPVHGGNRGFSVDLWDLASPRDLLWGPPCVLRVVAMPTVLSTITAPHVVSQSVDPVTTSQCTVYTDLTLAPGALVGKLIIGSGSMEYGFITKNTVTDIETTFYRPFTAPLSICDLGATFRNDPSSYWATFTYNGWVAYAMYSGIGFRHSMADDEISSVEVMSSGVMVDFEACEFEGLKVYQPVPGETEFGYCHFIAPVAYNAQSMLGLSGFFDHTTIRTCNIGVHMFNATFDGCEILCGAMHHGGATYSVWGGGTVRMNWCKVRNAPGHGILLRGLSRAGIYQTTIDDSVGSAVAIDGCTHCFIFCQEMAGSGNGRYGLEITSGSQVCTDTGTIVGNLGALKCGSRAEMSWADWVTAGKVVNDLASVDPQMCRISNAPGVY